MTTMRAFIILCLVPLASTLLAQGPVIDGGAVVDAAPPEREHPVLPEELEQKLESIRDSKQALVDALKKVLEDYADASADQRKAAAEAWRDAHVDQLAAQREQARIARLEVKSWLEENRPERPLPPEVEAGSALTADQSEEQLAILKQNQAEILESNKQLAAAIQQAASEDERREIIAQHRTQRLEQIREQQRLQDLRSDKLDRASSLAAIQDSLRLNAESIRIRNRIDDRNADPRLSASTIRDTAASLRDAAVRRTTDSVVRPDQPDRPVIVDRETLDSNGPSTTDGDADSRRDLLRETRN